MGHLVTCVVQVNLPQKLVNCKRLHYIMRCHFFTAETN